MIEKIYLVLILVFFILAFAIRNFKTYLSTKKSIRGKSVNLTMSIIISTLIYALIFLRIIILESFWIIEIDLTAYPQFKIIGLLLVSFGFVIGISALITMKNSWRIGITYNHKTNLITSGIFRISRNPYFLSYDILFLGFILIFPSIILAVMYLLLVIIFHKMILGEEKYLESVHKTKYLDYKNKVKRYLTIK